MRKILIWCIGFIFLTIFITVAFSYTHIGTISYVSKYNEEISPLKSSIPFKIAISGDSIAKGTGDEKTSGFSTYLPEYLNESKNISAYNAGINELKSSQLLEILKKGQLDSQISNSDMIVLSIGGNDLLTIYNVKDSQKLGTLKNVQAQYLENLNNILQIIRDKSPNSLIVFPGLYNPQEGKTPFLYTMLLNLWNNSTSKLISKYGNTIFINTQDIFQSNIKSYISSDGLHPNSAGYNAISQNIAQMLGNISK